MPRTRSAKFRCLFCLVLAAMSAGNLAAAETCAPEPQGEGRIAAVIDARTIRLDDGRQIRLAGLAPIAQTQGAGDLLSRHIGATVSLHGDDEAPDRYGRQHAVVFPAGGEAPLQVSLLAAGAALYDGVLDAPGCRQEFTAAEAGARRQHSGVWSAASPHVLSAENPGDISDRIGQFAVVEGQVLSVRQAGGTSYLNFGRRWTRGFSVTIPSRSRTALEAGGISLSTFEGRRVRVRGFIDARTGPRIEATRPAQIELANEPAAVTTIGSRD